MYVGAGIQTCDSVRSWCLIVRSAHQTTVPPGFDLASNLKFVYSNTYNFNSVHCGQMEEREQRTQQYFWGESFFGDILSRDHSL